MKNILWISRHEMTAPQLADLRRVMGDSVELTQFSDTVTDLGKLEPLIERADAIAAVLPMDLTAELLKISCGKPVLQAVSERQPTGRVITLPDGRQEKEFAFIHRFWQQVLRIEIETRRL
jgi:hypothetical protein